jgi:hypothetical protein
LLKKIERAQMLIKRLSVLGVFRTVACHQISVESSEFGARFTDVRVDSTDGSSCRKSKGTLLGKSSIPLLEK